MSKTYSKLTKQELKASMNDGLTQLLAFIDEYSEEQMLQPKDAAGWNVRDHITHLATWAEGMAALLRREDRWAAMGLVLDNSSKDNLDYDTMNAQIAAQHRHLSPKEARNWLVAAHERVIAALELLDEEALLLPYARFVTPFSGDGGKPIAGLIAGNTFGHYKQHTPWIEAIVKPMSAL